MYCDKKNENKHSPALLAPFRMFYTTIDENDWRQNGDPYTAFLWRLRQSEKLCLNCEKFRVRPNYEVGRISCRMCVCVRSSVWMNREYLPYAHAADKGTQKRVGQDRSQIPDESFLQYQFKGDPISDSHETDYALSSWNSTSQHMALYSAASSGRYVRTVASPDSGCKLHRRWWAAGTDWKRPLDQRSPVKERAVEWVADGAPWGAKGLCLLSVTDRQADYTHIVHFSSPILADGRSFIFPVDAKVTTMCLFKKNKTKE